MWTLEHRKISFPCQESNSGLSIPQIICYSAYDIPDSLEPKHSGTIEYFVENPYTVMCRGSVNIHKALVLIPFVLRLFTLTSLANLHHLMMLSHFWFKALSVATFYHANPLFQIWKSFLGALAKLRKATICFATSVSPTVCPHGTTRSHRMEFSWKLIFEHFFENLSTNPLFITIWQKELALHTKTYAHLRQYLVDSIVESEMFQKTL